MMLSKIFSELLAKVDYITKAKRAIFVNETWIKLW